MERVGGGGGGGGDGGGGEMGEYLREKKDFMGTSRLWP